MVSIMLPELFVTPTIDPKWSVSKNAAVPLLLIRANSSLTWSPHKYRVCIVFVLLRSAHTFQFELPVLPARAGSLSFTSLGSHFCAIVAELSSERRMWLTPRIWQTAESIYLAPRSRMFLSYLATTSHFSALLNS